MENTQLKLLVTPETLRSIADKLVEIESITSSAAWQQHEALAKIAYNDKDSQFRDLSLVGKLAEVCLLLRKARSIIS